MEKIIDIFQFSSLICQFGYVLLISLPGTIATTTATTPKSHNLKISKLKMSLNHQSL